MVVYGIGNCGFVTLALFTSAMRDIEVVAFCDRMVANISDFHGYRVIDIEELATNYKEVEQILNSLKNVRIMKKLFLLSPILCSMIIAQRFPKQKQYEITRFII